jgi:hypothetical protein
LWRTPPQKDIAAIRAKTVNQDLFLLKDFFSLVFAKFAEKTTDE